MSDRDVLREGLAEAAPELDVDAAWARMSKRIRADQRSRSAQRVIASLVFVLVIVAAVVATQRANTPSTVETPVADASAPVITTSPPTPTTVRVGGLEDLMATRTDEEFDADLARMPPEQREGMRQLRAMMRTGVVPVAGPNGERLGFVQTAALEAPLPHSRADLYPVRDETGAIVAYFGGRIGIIEKSLVDSAEPIDFQQLQSQSPFKVGGDN